MADGLSLMLVGMSTVFAFLTLLVLVMEASARFFEANAHRFDTPEPVVDTAEDTAVIAAVLAAAAVHRRRGGR